MIYGQNATDPASEIISEGIDKRLRAVTAVLLAGEEQEAQIRIGLFLRKDAGGFPMGVKEI